MNKEKFIFNIKGLIANNRVNDALNELSWFIQKEGYSNDFKDTIVLLSARFNQLQKEDRLGILSYGERNMSSNQILFAILELLKDLGERTPSAPNRQTVVSNDTVVNNSKNVVLGTIKNVGTVHIGDKIIEKTVVNLSDQAQADEKTVENSIQQQSKIKILFLSANSKNSSALRLDKEMRNIEETIQNSRHRDRFDLKKVTAVRVKDLQQALLDFSPHFVHFSGHGTNKGIALLDNQTDHSQLVASEPLAHLFRLFSNDVACVFLNSCFSKQQATQIRKFIPNVIGMASTIQDETAILFATSFYQAIGAGREIRFAFEFAKNSIDLNGVVGSHVPIYLD